MTVTLNNAAVGIPSSASGDWFYNQNRRKSLRVLCGYTQPGAAGYTYQVATTAEAAYIAVRLCIFNVQAASIVVNCAVASSSSPAGNNPTGSWVQVTKNSSTSITLPAGDGAKRPSVTVTDWMQVKSVSRADGGTLPVLFARLYSASAPYVTGDTSSTDGAEWGTISGAIGKGRVIYDGCASGDFVTANQSAYVGIATYGTAITGFEFLHETDVLTVMSLGDNQHQGDGGVASKLLGPIVRAAIAESQTGVKPVQYSNYGWSSDTTSGYVNRLTDLLAAGLRPNVVVTSPWSTNDVTTSSIDFFGFAIARMRENAMAIKSLCDIYGIKLVWVNWFPYVFAGTRDVLRRAYNTEIAALAQELAIDLIDWDGAVRAGTTPDTIAAGLTSDYLHLNDAGLAVAAAASAPAITALRDAFFA